MIRFLRDILLSLGGAIALLVTVLLICIPVTLIFAGVVGGITWVVVQISGWTWQTAQMVTMGTLAMSCLTASVYMEKKRSDAWIQSILDAADARAQEFLEEAENEADPS